MLWMSVCVWLWSIDVVAVLFTLMINSFINYGKQKITIDCFVRMNVMKYEIKFRDIIINSLELQIISYFLLYRPFRLALKHVFI